MSNASDEPAELGQLARLIRSKNAGPFMLTIDVMFDDAATYERVRTSECLAPARIARIYDVPVEVVQRYESTVALAIKVSFPRRWSSGSVDDRDVYGGQLHAPLVRLPV